MVVDSTLKPKRWPLSAGTALGMKKGYYVDGFTLLDGSASIHWCNTTYSVLVQMFHASELDLSEIAFAVDRRGGIDNLSPKAQSMAARIQSKTRIFLDNKRNGKYSTRCPFAAYVNRWIATQECKKKIDQIAEIKDPIERAGKWFGPDKANPSDPSYDPTIDWMNWDGDCGSSSSSGIANHDEFDDTELGRLRRQIAEMNKPKPSPIAEPIADAKPSEELLKLRAQVAEQKAKQLAEEQEQKEIQELKKQLEIQKLKQELEERKAEKERAEKLKAEKEKAVQELEKQKKEDEEIIRLRRELEATKTEDEKEKDREADFIELCNKRISSKSGSSLFDKLKKAKLV